jgi:hypothetical protein
MHSVLLLDQLTHSKFDLKTGDYEFESSTGTSVDRFRQSQAFNYPQTRYNLP